MNAIDEPEFERILLKSLFREILLAKEIYPINLLEKMVGILADLFLREFASGNLPSKILRENKNIKNWLENKIENFEP